MCKRYVGTTYYTFYICTFLKAKYLVTMINL